eukprot:10082729-Karenia_brevis.AAC.1
MYGMRQAASAWESHYASRLESELKWIKSLMESLFEVKVRAVLGPEETDDTEVVILGRLVTWKEDRIEYAADPKHRRQILEYFGFSGNTKAGAVNGYKEDRIDEESEELLSKSEAK